MLQVLSLSLSFLFISCKIVVQLKKKSNYRINNASTLYIKKIIIMQTLSLLFGCQGQFEEVDMFLYLMLKERTILKKQTRNSIKIPLKLYVGYACVTLSFFFLFLFI